MAVGSTITVDVNVTNAPSFNGYEFSLFYDATNLTLSKVNLNSGTVFDTPYADGNDTSTPGIIRESVVSLNGQFSLGFGVLAFFTFNIKGVGASPFTLATGTSTPSDGATLFDWTRLVLGGTIIDVSTSDGYFQNRQNSVLTALSIDPRIKFVDSNNNGVWDPGESVVYDTNNNNLYDSGEPIFATPTPSTGTALKTDSHIKYWDSDSNGIWDSGESVVFDTNNNGLHDSGETVFTGIEPPTTKLGPVARFTFSPVVPQRGQTIVFNATASFDPDNPLSTAITRYVWDFGDGIVVPSQSPIQNHSYGTIGAPSTGNFSVLLTVHDSDNNFTGKVTRVLGILPPPFHEVIVSSVIVSPTLAEPGAKLKVTVIVENTARSTFDETYNLSITWGPPTRQLKNYTNQVISHQFGKNTQTFKDTLDTTGLSSGTYEVDALAIDPLDNATTNDSGKAIFSIQLPQTSPLPYILGGAVAVVAALVVVRLVLKRRRRPPEDE